MRPVFLLALCMIAGALRADEPAPIALSIDELVERDLGWAGMDSAPDPTTLRQAPDQARLPIAAAMHFHGEPGAMTELQRAILEIQGTHGLFAEQLILPYRLLAREQAAQGRFKDADRSLARAQHVTHRLWGNANVAQLSMVEERAGLQARLGEFYEAEELERLAVRLNRERFGVTSEAFVDSTTRLGLWLRRQGLYKEALTELRGAIKVISAEAGSDSPLLVPLHRARAMTLLGGPLAGRSIGETERALALMDANPDVFSPDERIAARVELGDLMMIFSYERWAVREYRKAWELADAAQVESWLVRLAKPELVRTQTFKDPVKVVSVVQEFGFEVDITHDGRVRRAALTRPMAGPVDYYAPRIFRSEARFRPPIVNGEAVAVHDLRLELAVGPSLYGAPRVFELFRPMESLATGTSVAF
ncbi:MAG: hypothetical protein AAGE01_20595 [Pseudomonadota bacterium]